MNHLPKEFGREFRKQLEEVIEEEITKPDGKKIKIPTAYPRKDIAEFTAGMLQFWQKCYTNYDQFWKTETARLGHQRFNHNPFTFFEEIPDCLKKYAHRQRMSDPQEEIVSKIREGGQRAFDLYTCIQDVTPDRIVTLTNGAARLLAITNALGFDAANYLAIHRNANGHRSDMPKEIIYEGKPIVPGSTVLILEDVSEMGEERTYRNARKWLAEQGVNKSPVFLERVNKLIELPEDTSRKSDDYIQFQSEVNADNCYNSLVDCPYNCREFWSGTNSKIADAIERNPEMYDQLFKHIQSPPTQKQSI